MRGIGVATIVLGIALGITAVASAGQTAEIIEVKGQSGSASFDVILAVPKHIDSAARKRGLDYGLCIHLTYVSVNNTPETWDSGRKSIATDSVLVVSEKGKAIEQVGLNFGSSPLPGAIPSFEGTATILAPDETVCP